MTYQAQLKELLDAGYRVRVQHQRIWIPDPRAKRIKFQSVGAGREAERSGNGSFQAPWVISAKGGCTIVQIRRSGDDPTILAEGYAYCSPNDNFVKKVGLHKALGLAIKELHQRRPLTADERRFVSAASTFPGPGRDH